MKIFYLIHLNKINQIVVIHNEIFNKILLILAHRPLFFFLLYKFNNIINFNPFNFNHLT
jgi:hypothetical protein